MRLGIFGGTFDPPHLGHLILAAEAADQLHLDRLLWVLTSSPPHKLKQIITPLEQRLDMVQAVLALDSAFELSRVDIDRPPPHFAVDTVRLLRTQYPGAELIYLMGGDSLHDLPRWHAPQTFVELCDELGVMRRPSDQIDLPVLEQALPGLSSKLRFIHCPLIEISSSQIRERMTTGRPYRYFLPPAVYDLIQTNATYLPVTS